MSIKNRSSWIYLLISIAALSLFLIGFAGISYNNNSKIKGKGDAMAPQYLHEPPDKLSKKTIDLHRAIRSLIEELEATDWYQQRVDATDDEALKKILAHNRDEEKEHAAMLLEWIRRNDPKIAEELKTYLFTKGEITEIEEKKKE